MLYIMRHGRTVWNMEHKLQGKTDVPLSEAGRSTGRIFAGSMDIRS